MSYMKAQTTHRYIFFIFYFSFDTNLFFNVYIGSVYGLGGLRWVAMKAQMMPDALFGPWLHIFYFYFDTNLFFSVYIGSIYVLYGLGWLRWAAMKAQMMLYASFGP
jgi:hypothetical protein